MSTTEPDSTPSVQRSAALAGPPPPTIAAGSGLRRSAERSLVRRLTKSVDGLRVVEEIGTPPGAPSGMPLAPSNADGPHQVTVRDRRAYAAVSRSGSAGLGEAWFRGWWDADDLVGFLRLLIRNVGRMDHLRNRVHIATRPVLNPVRRIRRADPARDRRNVRAHYDLSNDFFTAFLDETMTYSCAVFERPDVSLGEASVAKLERLCRKVGLQPEHHVVEIGTGWGSFALHAAGKHGARVTTTTISAAQAELARKRFADAGLTDRIELREVDYRDLTGTFDRLVSIEMIEAVDWRDVPVYLRTCADLLAPDGVMGLQAITMADQRWERTRVTQDFIKQWVFPGGCLPSVTSIADAATRATDLRIVDVEDLGFHYAETLHRWRDRLHARWGDLESLGVTEELGRLWDFYLAYCEAAFLERHVSVVQMVLVKPDWRPTGLTLRAV